MELVGTPKSCSTRRVCTKYKVSLFSVLPSHHDARVPNKLQASQLPASLFEIYLIAVRKTRIDDTVCCRDTMLIREPSGVPSIEYFFAPEPSVYARFTG